MQPLSLFRLEHKLRTALWPIPVLCVLAGVAISLLTVTFDSADWVSVDFVGGPDAALAILGAIAASMITLTGIVLSIVLVVVQLAMGQFSPRIVRTILYDRLSQLSIGVFAATFAHAMLAMRDIGSTEDGEPVPGLAILVAFALVVFSIILLIVYINHIGQSLRAADLIDSVGDETLNIMNEIYPKSDSRDIGVAKRVIPAPDAGVLFHANYDELVAVAKDAMCSLTLCPMIGDFVPKGAPLFEIEGDNAGVDSDRALKAVALGPERTLNQDVAYGFRMLVDIAERCLTDAFDPTTAVQAIDRLHDCLRQLATRDFPPPEYHDEAGVLRLRVRHMTWEGYVHLAFDEIRQTGANSSQVVRRTRSALEDLLAVAPAERRAPLEEQLSLLQAAVAENDWPEVEKAKVFPDVQGIGAGEDLRDHDPPATK